jgi:hypothetical protein
MCRSRSRARGKNWETPLSTPSYLKLGERFCVCGVRFLGFQTWEPSVKQNRGSRNGVD